MVVIEALSPPGEGLAQALCTWRPDRLETYEGSHGEFLEDLGEIQVRRALRKTGLSVSKVDRFLAQPCRATSWHGPSLGGLHPGWFRRAGERWVALSWRSAQIEGWWGLDLAALEVYSGSRLESRHHEGVENQDEALVAWRLFCLSLWLREGVLGHSQEAFARARSVVEDLLHPQTSQVVHVDIQGPEWLDSSAWIPEDGQVSDHHARWLTRNLDGVWVGGHSLQVTCTPPLRPGRGAPRRENREVRQERLFSRWQEGIRHDEEGLYSLTPEDLAMAMVEGLSGTCMDGTCGIGGLTIALARQPQVGTVLAIDNHRGRLEMARHNSSLYEGHRKIRFLQGRVEEALEKVSPDWLVLDPPWGGPDYDPRRMGIEDLGLDLRQVLALAPERVLLKLPRSFDVSQLPGEWSTRAAIDDRGILKFLVCRRG
jgi:trimethylguanosine synthase